MPILRCHRLLLEAAAPARRFSSDALHRIEAKCACHFPRFSTRLERCHRHHESGDLLVIGIHAARRLPVFALALDLLDTAKPAQIPVETGGRVVVVDGTRPAKQLAAEARG